MAAPISNRSFTMRVSYTELTVLNEFLDKTMDDPDNLTDLPKKHKLAAHAIHTKIKDLIRHANSRTP